MGITRTELISKICKISKFSKIWFVKFEFFIKYFPKFFDKNFGSNGLPWACRMEENGNYFFQNKYRFWDTLMGIAYDNRSNAKVPFKNHSSNEHFFCFDYTLALAENDTLKL